MSATERAPRRVLLVGAQVSEVPFDRIPSGMRRIRELGQCDFCDRTIMFSRLNHDAMKEKKQQPVLCCIPCYTTGNYRRQGFTTND